MVQRPFPPCQPRALSSRSLNDRVAPKEGKGSIHQGNARAIKAKMELGFVEEVEDPEELTSPFFPSKVGGKPAWLDLMRVPSVDTLSCSKCGKPLISLLQIQSSPSSSCDDDHHRTLFLFLCTDSKCHSSGDTSCSIVALRCETKRCLYDNHNAGSLDTFSSEGGVVSTDTRALSSFSVPKSSNDDASSLELGLTTTSLCVVCGGRGPKHCGSCKCAHYCSRTHQLHDWKAGHKRACPELAQGQCFLETLDYNPSLGVVLPELAIVTELEPISCRQEGKDRSDEERMRDYWKYMETEMRGKLEEDGGVEQLEKAATASEKKEKLFRAFKKRISVEPTQV